MNILPIILLSIYIFKNILLYKNKEYADCYERYSTDMKENVWPD